MLTCTIRLTPASFAALINVRVFFLDPLPEGMIVDHQAYYWLPHSREFAAKLIFAQNTHE